MEHASIRIELVNAAVPGLRFGFDVPVPAEASRYPASFPDRAAVSAFAASLLASASSATASLSFLGLSHADLIVASVASSADRASSRRFDVAMPDGTAATADGRDFSEASLVAAIGFAFSGKPFSQLLASADATASAISAAGAAARNPVVEGAHCVLELRDWRVPEDEGDSLTDAQTEPFSFSLCSGGYGPVAVFAKGDQEYTVAMEIDHGCVAVHVQGPSSDNAIATIRVARTGMQANLTAHDGRFESFMVGDTVERADPDYKLTQDGPAATAPTV